MFGSCKLLFVLLYFVFGQNVVGGSSAGETSDNDSISPVPVVGGTSSPSVPAMPDRLKLNHGNAVEEGSDEPEIKNEGDNKEAPADGGDKKEEPSDDGNSPKNGDASDDIEKNEEVNGGRKDEAENDGGRDEAENDGGKGEDGEDHKAKKLKGKKNAMSFVMEDMTASLNWPLGIVPYYMDTTIFDYIVAYNLRKAMDLIESVSCIQFKTLLLMPTQNTTWINITNPNKVRECVHEREEAKSGEIVMVLGFDCMKQKQILHTLLHAVGFKDEVTHPLRDQYIHVIWDNIQPKYLHLFRSQPNEVASRTMYEYDPASIMHFHDRAFSKNGQATIQPLLPGLQVGPSDTLSALDKLKLRTLFGRECNKRKIVGLQESCKNVIGKKMKSPDDDGPLETLKLQDKQEEPDDIGKLKGLKKKPTKHTQSMEQRIQKKEEIAKDDDLRSSEGN